MKLKAFFVATLTAPVLIACGAEEKKDTFKLNAAGATFPAPLYNSWLQDFAKETGNQVNYQAVGSGSGVRQFTAETIDFGACLLYTSPSPRDMRRSRMPSSA